jgi:hypothetical protein
VQSSRRAEKKLLEVGVRFDVLDKEKIWFVNEGKDFFE